jgi:hypothetical protein
MQPPRRPDDIQEMRQREQALEQVFALGDEPGVLLIVDYAEGRQREVEDLARLLARRPLTGARPVRLVLLARGDGWWKDFYLQKEGIEPVFRLTGKPHGDVHALTPIPAGEARRDFFDRTVTAFRPGMEAMAKAGMIPRWDGQPPNQQRVIRLIREPAYARPLAIQMEAMLHLASATPEPGAQGVDVLLDKVLGVERAHWGKLLGRLDDDRLRDQNRGVAQVTAVAGVPSPEAAEGLLMADLFYQGVRTAPVHVDPVRRDLVRVYGKADGGIAHLEPDLIGEHQVASIGDVQLIEGCLTWIEAGSQPERAKRRRDLITVLQRATQPEHGAHVAAQASALLDHVVRGRMASLAGDIVAVMADTPGRLREVVESALDALDAEGLVALDGALPLMHLQLLELALEVSQRHVQAAQAQLARAEADAVAPERLEAARSAYAKRGRSARQPSLRSGAARGGAQRQRGGGGHQKAAGRDPPRGLPARSGEQPRHSQRRPLWPWAPRGGASVIGWSVSSPASRTTSRNTPSCSPAQPTVMAIRTAEWSAVALVQGWSGIAMSSEIGLLASRCRATTRRLNTCVIELVVTRPNLCVGDFALATISADRSHQYMTKSELSLIWPCTRHSVSA